MNTIVSLIQKVGQCTVCSLVIRNVDDTVDEYQTDAPCPHTAVIETQHITAILRYNAAEEFSSDMLDTIRQIIELGADRLSLRPCKAMHGALPVLNTLITQKSIDEVLYDILWELVRPGLFEKAGILFLNEALMQLRGVVFVEQGRSLDPAKLRFKSVKLPLENRNPVSDVMFYDRQDEVVIEQYDPKGMMSLYFTGSTLVAPISYEGKPLGVICVSRPVYSRQDRAILEFYSKLCVMGISLNRMRKQLGFALQDLDYFKQTFYATDTLIKIGKLAATVAHELRNPLVAIGGFARRLDHTLENPAHKNYVRIIVNEVDRLERIVGDILLYAKKIELVRTEHTVRELVEDVLNLFNDKMAFMGVTVTTEIPPETMVSVDTDRFKQVLLNVVNNALHVMDNGGMLDITSVESGKHVVISFEDSGGGVPDHIIDKVFEPFFTTKDGGTGLGLPLCKKIMVTHGGDISVANTERGAVFSIVIPKAGGTDGD